MKEELHQMLDGELPDDAMAELLHLLSVDPEKRRLFRQQMVLQHALVRNESMDIMTPDEDHEVLSNLTRAVGINDAGTSDWKSWVAVGMLTVGLFVGGGAGYLLGAADPDPQMATRQEPAIEKLQMPAAPIVVAAPINRDSLVNAVRDSLILAMNNDSRPTVAAAPAAAKKITPRQTVRRRPVRTGGGSDDLTGANEVRANRNKKKSNRR